MPEIYAKSFVVEKENKMFMDAAIKVNKSCVKYFSRNKSHLAAEKQQFR